MIGSRSRDKVCADSFLFFFLFFLSWQLQTHLSNAVSCPGGWDPDTGVFEKEINAQIDLAFSNVDRALKDAGGKGWEQVFRINSYHLPLNREAEEAMVRNLKKWMPNHQPLWTCIGVARLAEDDMRVEIEVSAHDPEGAATAKASK